MTADQPWVLMDRSSASTIASKLGLARSASRFGFGSRRACTTGERGPMGSKVVVLQRAARPFGVGVAPRASAARPAGASSSARSTSRSASWSRSPFFVPPLGSLLGRPRCSGTTSRSRPHLAQDAGFWTLPSGPGGDVLQESGRFVSQSRMTTCEALGARPHGASSRPSPSSTDCVRRKEPQRLIAVYFEQPWGLAPELGDCLYIRNRRAGAEHFGELAIFSAVFPRCAALGRP